MEKKIKNPVIDALFEYIDNFNLKFADTKETFKSARLATYDRKEEIVKVNCTHPKPYLFYLVLDNEYNLKIKLLFKIIYPNLIYKKIKYGIIQLKQ